MLCLTKHRNFCPTFHNQTVCNCFMKSISIAFITLLYDFVTLVWVFLCCQSSQLVFHQYLFDILIIGQILRLVTYKIRFSDNCFLCSFMVSQLLDNFEITSMACFRFCLPKETCLIDSIIVELIKSFPNEYNIKIENISFFQM